MRPISIILVIMLHALLGIVTCDHNPPETYRALISHIPPRYNDTLQYQCS